VPIDATDVFLLAVVLIFTVWALRSLVRALGTETRRRELLRAFAAERGLREKEAGERHSDMDVTVEGLRRAWSRDPALADPPRGSRVFEGTLHGLSLVVDEVWIKKWWTNSRDAHLRMAVELPGLPPGIRVRPAGRMRRIARAVSRGGQSGPEGRPSRLEVAFSEPVEDRAREEGFLTPDRVRTLEDYEGAGDAYLQGGRLLLIRPWRATRKPELVRLHEEIGLLARRLVERR
jgi:hypothetical protein